MGNNWESMTVEELCNLVSDSQYISTLSSSDIQDLHQVFVIKIEEIESYLIQLGVSPDVFRYPNRRYELQVQSSKLSTLYYLCEFLK
jgi:hypothetical protein